MTSIVSAISGHFSRGLVFGTLVPSVTFTIIGWLVIESWLPATLSGPAWVQQLGSEWRAAILAFVAALISALLWSCNVPLTRLYEGYSWKDSWIGKRRTARQRKLCDAYRVRWTGLRTLRYALENWAPASGPAPTAKQQDDLADEHSRIGRELHASFPQPPNLVLPTRLGNVIRAFESYPRNQYQISAIPMWPRLVAVIDKDYASAIADQRASFDFMLNGATLCGVCAAALLVVGLIFPLPFVHASWLVTWIAEIGAFLIAACMFYEGAVGRAAAWGDMVKGAFDLYRHALLAQLGFKSAPASLADERRMWGRISQQIIFGSTRRVALPEFAATRTHVVSTEPAWLRIGLHRSADAPDASSGVQRVHLTLRNEDPAGVAAKRIVVRDELPAGADFRHGSLNPATIGVTGASAMEFTVGPLASGGQLEFSFDIVRHKT